MEADTATLRNTEGYGCILRVSAGDVDIDDLLSRVKIVPYRLDRKGQPRLRLEHVSEHNEFHILTHKAREVSLQTQITETIAFFRTHAEDLARIMSFPGVTGAELDIGIVGRDVIVQNEYLPPELLMLIGKLGIGINLSMYPVSESDSDPPGQS